MALVQLQSTIFIFSRVLVYQCRLRKKKKNEYSACPTILGRKVTHFAAWQYLLGPSTCTYHICGGILESVSWSCIMNQSDGGKINYLETSYKFSKVKAPNLGLAMPLGYRRVIMGPKYCTEILYQEPAVSAIRQTE